MIRRIARHSASKQYPCDGCGEFIEPGREYLLHVAVGLGDVANVGWWRFRECRACAVRHHRPEMRP